MSIKPVKVERDENGYWTHPELPEWDESTKRSEVDAWFLERNLDYHVLWLEHDADDAIVAQYFDEGDPNISKWNPESPRAGAFLLSIHDTEEGPVSLWAVQVAQPDVENALDGWL